MTDVGVRVASIGKWSRAKENTDCPLCHILIRDREYDVSADSPQSLHDEQDQFFYAFSGQYCFQETGMDLEQNFLVVRPDLETDQKYGMDPVLVKGRQIHGINHKLHPDLLDETVAISSVRPLQSCPNLSVFGQELSQEDSTFPF
jgi:hypothetical protein